MVANRKETQMAKNEELPPPELNISADKVCYIILKAREYDVKVEPSENDPGSNPTDDDEREILEDRGDDPTLAELRSAIDDLNDDEVVDLIALAWLAFDRRTFDFNAVATLIVWIMTLFIQRSSHRDTLAIHAKLDELIRADENARSELTRLDEKEPELIAKHRDAEVRALHESR